MKGILITLASIVVIGILITVGYFVFTNSEISLRETVNAQQEICEANHDKMFKVITQTAKVPDRFMDKARESFDSIYPKLIEGRYASDGDMLMKWVQESNPEFDLNAFSSLYENVQIAIESNRQEFFMEQKKLIDLQREHKVFISKYPAKFFLKNKKEVEITIIKSTNTNNVYESGVDDNIDLF